MRAFSIPALRLTTGTATSTAALTASRNVLLLAERQPQKAHDLEVIRETLRARNKFEYLSRTQT